MKCPSCGGKVRTLTTADRSRTLATPEKYRRYQCLHCGGRFSTLEQLLHIARDGQKALYWSMRDIP